MDFSFRAETFRQLLQCAIDQHVVPLESSSRCSGGKQVQQLVSALSQAVDAMAQADAGIAAASSQANGHSPVTAVDISRIGDETLVLLEQLVSMVEAVTGHQNRELLRLTVPVALWVARRGGCISHLELVVNSLAGYANELTDMSQLADLTRVIREVIDASSEDVRRDHQQTSLLRPWRVLNLNYGIVATRSHDPALMDEAYAILIKHLPQDARRFFREGMQQMNIVGYPEHVREVVARYDAMMGADSTLH